MPVPELIYTVQPADVVIGLLIGAALGCAMILSRWFYDRH